MTAPVPVVIMAGIVPIGGGPEGHATFDVIEQSAGGAAGMTLLYRCSCGFLTMMRNALTAHMDAVRAERNVEAQEVDHE